MKVTLELIEEMRTKRGGFSGAALKVFGGSTSPKKGWKHRAVGMEVTSAQLLEITKGNTACDRRAEAPKTLCDYYREKVLDVVHGWDGLETSELIAEILRVTGQEIKLPLPTDGGGF